VISRSRIYPFFKYTVYTLLAFNVYFFFVEEWAAAPHRFGDGILPGQIYEGFAATIDTAAWVVLLLMFELETRVPADHHFSNKAGWSLHSLRAVGYAFIVYAFFGYLAKLLLVSGVDLAPGISNLCAVATDQWAYAIDYKEYEIITAFNCAELSRASVFYQFPGMDVLVDLSGKTDITRLAWVDAINAAAWLLVVIVLEIDVRLQDRDRLQGLALSASSISKYILYSLLFLAAVYWGFKGDFVEFWDALLWLVAFTFIEMNIFGWRQESLQAVAESTA